MYLLRLVGATQSLFTAVPADKAAAKLGVRRPIKNLTHWKSR